LNNSAKNEPILLIFGTQKPDEISYQNIVKSSTFSVYYHCATLRNAEVAFFVAYCSY